MEALRLVLDFGYLVRLRNLGFTVHFQTATIQIAQLMSEWEKHMSTLKEVLYKLNPVRETKRESRLNELRSNRSFIG